MSLHNSENRTVIRWHNGHSHITPLQRPSFENHKNAVSKANLVSVKPRRCWILDAATVRDKSVLQEIAIDALFAVPTSHELPLTRGHQTTTHFLTFVCPSVVVVCPSVVNTIAWTENHILIINSSAFENLKYFRFYVIAAAINLDSSMMIS